MSCYGVISENTRVWVYYDTSGSVSSEDLDSLRAAIDEVITALGEEGVAPGNITEVNSTSERYLQWFQQSADDYVVIAFINEADNLYHSEFADSGPTSAWTTDYNNFISHLAGVTRFRGLIYALSANTAISDTTDEVNTFNQLHIPAAVPGEGTYPSNPSLADLGVRYRVDVETDQDSSVYYADIADFLLGWAGGGFCDRVRMSHGSTVGSLLESTAVAALESQFDEAHFLNVELREDRLLNVQEALTPTDVSFRVYPVPVNSQELLSEYAGETKLGRMASTYPRPLIDQAQDLIGEDELTATQVVEQLFQAWASEFGWFTYKPVPDLRFRTFTEGWKDDISSTDGVVTVSAITVTQESGQRKTMRQILDEVLSLYPGTALIQDADGDIVIKTTYGPDAPTEPKRTLTQEDLVNMSTGRGDPRSRRNRARVESQGFEFVDEQVLTSPAYTSLMYFNPTGLLAMPGAREEVEPSTVHEFEAGTVISGDTIELEYQIDAYSVVSGSDPMVEGNPSALYNEATELGTLTLYRDGSWSDVVINGQVAEPTGRNFSCLFRFRWLEGQGVEVRAEPTKSNVYVGFPVFTQWFFGWVAQWDVVGTEWARSPEAVVGSFGYDNEELVNADGEDILAASVEAFGEREITVRTSVFNLTPAQAGELAQALVMHYAEARVVRRVVQSWWNAFPVRPDDIGELVELPNTEVGFVQRRDVRENFEDPLGGSIESEFELVLVTEAVSTEGLLAYDSGDLFRLDSGELVRLS